MSSNANANRMPPPIFNQISQGALILDPPSKESMKENKLKKEDDELLIQEIRQRKNSKRRCKIWASVRGWTYVDGYGYG